MNEIIDTFFYPISVNASPKTTVFLCKEVCITPIWDTFTFLGSEKWPPVGISYHVYRVPKES